MTATLIVMVGLPAAGKTTRARELELSRSAIRFTPDEWMLPLFGESDAGGKRDVLEGRLISVAFRALQLGTNVILDFGMWAQDERSAVRWLANTIGALSEVVYLPVDGETQLVRVTDRFERAPHANFGIARHDLDAWRAFFQVPTAAELDGTLADDPPAGFLTWSEWATDRWPSLARFD